jgi:cell division FtsZ-interacting protein ZapD
MQKLREAIKELNRELETRRRVFPRWVQEKKLTQEQMDARINALEDALIFLISFEKFGQQILEYDKYDELDRAASRSK